MNTIWEPTQDMNEIMFVMYARITYRRTRGRDFMMTCIQKLHAVYGHWLALPMQFKRARNWWLEEEGCRTDQSGKCMPKIPLSLRARSLSRRAWIGRMIAVALEGSGSSDSHGVGVGFEPFGKEDSDLLEYRRWLTFGMAGSMSVTRALGRGELIEMRPKPGTLWGKVIFTRVEHSNSS